MEEARREERRQGKKRGSKERREDANKDAERALPSQVFRKVDVIEELGELFLRSDLLVQDLHIFS